MMHGRDRSITTSAAWQCLAFVLLFAGSGQGAEPVGSVRLGTADCPPYMLPPGQPHYPHYPPGHPAPFVPSQPRPAPASPGQTPESATPPSTADQDPSSSPASPTQQQPSAAPAQATPTFAPAQPTTAATSPQSAAPNMIGDFFGSITTEPIILPGAIVNQAILIEPASPLLDYYRVVTPTGIGTFETAADVLLGVDSLGQPVSVNLSQIRTQLLSEFDGSMFVGDPALLGMVTDPGPFLARDSGTSGDVDLLPPEPMGTLMGQTIYDIHETVQVFLPSPGSGGSVGRQKISENNSVFPRDRVFLNYSGFTDVPLSPTGENVHRYVPGWELAFWRQLMSVEVRLPFAATLDNDIRAGGLTNRNEVEFGNISTTLKALICQLPEAAVAIGVSASFPTAADVSLRDFDGETLLSLENNAVHVLPFIGAATTNGRWFAQGFVQGDIDTSGSRVEVLNEQTGNLQEVGELHDAAFLYVSASLGYWLYQNGCSQTTFSQECGRSIKRRVYSSDHWVTGFAPIAELHYNQSLEPSEVIEAGNLELRSFDQFSLTNLVLGGVMTFGSGGALQLAWATPIIGQDDRQFSNEVRVSVDWEL